MIEYLIVLVPIVLLIIGIYIKIVVTNIYRAASDAHEYLKERKELKWM